MKRFMTLIFVLGLMFTINSSAEWVRLENGLKNIEVLDLAVSGNNLFASTWHGVYFSSDNGNSWEQKGLKNEWLYTITASGNYVYTGGQQTGVFSSSDNGENWTYTGVDVMRVLSSASNGNNVIVGTECDGIFFSSDNGKSWSEKNNGYPYTLVTELEISGNNYYAAVNGGGVYLSTDNCENWIAKNGDTNNLHIQAFAVNSEEVVTGTFNNGIFLSTDMGDTWTTINSGLKNKTIFAITKIGKNYIASIYQDIIVSTDNAETWVSKDLNINWRNTYSLVVKDNYVFALTNSGMYRSKLVDLGITEIDGVKLSKNIDFLISPNPAKERISIVVPVDLDNVSIRITDICGLLCAEYNYSYLSNDNPIEIETGYLAWGTYFCTIRSGTCSGTKQFKVIK